MLTHATTWTELETIVLDERSQEKKRLHVTGFRSHGLSRTGKFVETESRLVVVRGWEEEVLLITFFFLIFCIL